VDFPKFLTERAFSYYFGIQTPEGKIITNEENDEIHDDLIARLKMGNLGWVLKSGGVRFDRGRISWSITVDYRFIDNLKKFVKDFVNEDKIYLDIIAVYDDTSRRPHAEFKSMRILSVETNKNKIKKLNDDPDFINSNRLEVKTLLGE